VIPLLVLAFLAALMLPFLRHRTTGRDGLYHCILWLSVAVGWVSRALFAIAEGYARFRTGVDAAAAAGRGEVVAAWKEAEVSR
jgi:hypothetical protein